VFGATPRDVQTVFDKEFIDKISERVAALVLEKLPRSGIEPRYLTFEQAGIYTGRSKHAMRYLASKKRFPVVHHGRLRLIDRHDLDAFLEGCKS
jgi:excisionase family DNA binding protein